MKKFLKFISPFRRIRKHAQATQTSPLENRRHIGRNVFYISLFLFTALALRLTWLVATNRVGGVNLAEAAKSNYTYSLTVYPTRGTIYDRTGVPIALDSSTYTIYVNLDKHSVTVSGEKLYAQPSEFSKLAAFLNKELGIPLDLATYQLNLKGAQVQFGTNGTNISLEKRQEIEAAAQKEGLNGIGFISNLARSYPNGIFASNLIGVASLKTAGDNNSGLVGNNGMEAAYNSILSGKPGTETLEKDKNGNAIPGAIISQTPPVNGQNIYTTLDAHLQSQLEQLINKSASDSGGQQLSATLMDAHTGEILATTQRPTFNPTTGQKTSNNYFTWNSLLYQTQYEPGSVMKTFLAASAFDSGHFNPNQTYYRSVNIDGTQINDWDISEYQHYLLPSTVTAAEGFMMSSNTVMSQIEMGMGNTLWDTYLQKFKFGVPTRIGMGYEAYGSLPADNPVSQVQSAFGQGIAVTQAQLLRAWTTFGNGGTMLEPHIVSKIVNPDTNKTLQSEPEIIGKPLSATDVNEVLGLMQQVNTNPTFGTAYLPVNFDNFTIGPMFVINGQAAAVKTGTAQIASPSGGYLTGTQDTLNSAVVMYPAQNPDFIFYETIEIPTKPWTLGWISEVANPLLTSAEALKGEINATEPNIDPAKVTLSNYSHQLPGNVADELRRTLLDPVVIGDGTTVSSQSIAAGTKVGANTKVLLLTDGDHTMPDMYGWSKENVEQLAKWYNLSVTYQGGGKKHTSGTITTQSIAENTIVKAGEKLTVTLSGN